QTTIYARVSGYVKKWFVDIGDHVKQGDVLATIETPELDQQLASEQAKVETCKAQIELAKANVHFSEATLARFKDAPKGIVSDLERDQKEADFQTSQARLTAAQSDLNSAQSEVDRLRAMIAFQKVTAPFDGIITQRHVDIGDLVTSGSTANTTSLFTLADSSQIRVFVNVPESAAPDIRDGAKAIATADEYPGREFLGRVARTSRAINDASKTLRVEADIPNPDATLLPGMFVRVNFEVQGRQPLLVIPASAINFRSGGPQVATVDENGRVKFHDVIIARDLGDAIEIKDGLKVNDRVVLNVSYQVANGDLVSPTEVELPGMPKPPKQVEATSENAIPLSLKAN
ncbi:MAG TPA: efflux RND transporter periplasmic adaptor subunit, partial [Phycisphaerae bacterium]